jgi:hypothetical protein
MWREALEKGLCTKGKGTSLPIQNVQLQYEHCSKLGHDITHSYDVHLKLQPNLNCDNHGG